MKHFNMRLAILCGVLLSNVHTANSQNFLWGRSGGSMMPGNGSELETVRDMATDANGNVYILTHTKKAGMNIAGEPITGYGGSDIILASFKPDGSLRWKKLIGNGSNDKGESLATDAKDGVYISAQVFQEDWPVQIDQDATTNKSYQRYLLIKYDTAGNYKWHRQPEADNLTAWSEALSMGLDVDDAGNTYWLMRLSQGSYSEGALNVPTSGVYLLKYSSSGAFSYIKPNMDADAQAKSGMYLTVDGANNRFYVSGTNTNGIISAGSNSISNGMFIAAFNIDGSFLWKKSNTGTSGSFSSRIAIDGKGNLYLAGAVVGQRSSGPATEFNGYIATNGEHGGPFITKIDKNGNQLWSRAGEAKSASSAAYCVGLRGREVIIAGSYAGTLEWSGYPYPGFSNSDNYDVFTTRFDTSNGYVLGMDRIASSSGSYEYPNYIVPDRKGNVYIGGDFGGDMLVNTNNRLQSTGGDTDWFLVKYGDMWPVSIAENNERSVKIYPNPATEYIILQGITAGSEIFISNMLGQEVYHGRASDGRLYISHLGSGNYLLHSTDLNGQKEIVKLIKN